MSQAGRTRYFARSATHKAPVMQASGRGMNLKGIISKQHAAREQTNHARAHISKAGLAA